MQHGGDALRHNNDRGVVSFSLQRTAQRHVGLVVQRREAVVKQIDLRVLGNSAGNRKALLLPAGDVAAALGNRAVEALGLSGDELRGLGNLGGLLCVGVGCVVAAELRLDVIVPLNSTPFCGT